MSADTATRGGLSGECGLSEGLCRFAADGANRNSENRGPMNFAWRIALRFAYRAALCYWFVVRPRTRGAHVAVWWQGQLLLVAHSYKHQQGFPAGGSRKGETSRETAVREAREEVGLALLVDDLHYAGRFKIYDEYKVDYAVVYEIDLSAKPTIAIDNREIVRADFVTLAELQSRPVTPVVQQYLKRRYRRKATS